MKILAIVLSLIIANSCVKENSSTEQQNSSVIKIMSLGASRVAGNRPEHESFRYELWKDLIDNGWTFDFIGTQSDGASYPIFNNLDFDIDHEGRGGWTSGQILNNINNVLALTGSPDIVLFSSPGGNDAIQNLPYNQTLSNIKDIITVLQNDNPDVTIIIEQSAPARSSFMTPELTTYFNQMKQDILSVAAQNSTTTSEVIAVDMFTGFTDSLLTDHVHYNVAGADFIASRYYLVLENLLEE